jgi:hypothetical protein
MKRTSRLVALVASLLLGRSASAQELADLNKPITIDLPGLLPFVTSLQPAGEWPLTIRLLANKPIGVWTARAGVFPSAPGETSFLVWADPDGVFTGKCYPGAPHPDCVVPTVADTYLEFTVGPSAQGASGSPLLVNCHPAMPGVLSYPGNTQQCAVGPPSGGYGRSSAVPGLVILSNTGVGKEFTLDPVTAIAWTSRARNLAGFADSIGWTVKDRMPFIPRTSVVAQMTVPSNLFKALLFWDASCSAGPCWSLEGTLQTGNRDAMYSAWQAVVTTVRIFVLDGPAPDLLEDLNHDGVVDARDALLAVNPVTQQPYRLLSGERVVRFQTETDTIGCRHLPIPFDLDGNGVAHVSCMEPNMGGGIRKPPP